MAREELGPISVPYRDRVALGRRYPIQVKVGEEVSVALHPPSVQDELEVGAEQSRLLAQLGVSNLDLLDWPTRTLVRAIATFRVIGKTDAPGWDPLGHPLAGEVLGAYADYMKQLEELRRPPAAQPDTESEGGEAAKEGSESTELGELE
jgi:hypothetical protein